MSVDAPLHATIAEIAGVFVGFGALISITRRSDAAAEQVGAVRAVVTAGLTVVVAALVPVALAGYGLAAGTLWWLSGLVFLLLSWAAIILSLRSAANRHLVTSLARERPAATAFFWIALELPIQVPLVLIVIGLLPDLVPALYLTALVFTLFEAAFVLTQFVYARQPG